MVSESVPFSKTKEQFRDAAAHGITKQIEAGNMTEADADLIRKYVNFVRIKNNISEARAYKITNALSNVCRFIRTPLMENSIDDIYEAVTAIKEGQKVLRNGRTHGGKLSQNTQRDYIQFLKRFYQWSIKKGYCNLSAEEIREIKPPGVKRITKTSEQMLTQDEIRQMIDACKGIMAIRNRAILSVLYEGGLRINELAGLKWKDVKFDRHFVKLNVCSKTEKPRYVPLVVSQNYLSAWRAEYPNGEASGDKFVFVTSKGVREPTGETHRVYKNLTYQYTRKLLLDLAKNAGIQKEITPHLFRHSRVTGMLQNGISESVIKMMCWGSLTSDMLANYGHLCNADTDAAIARAAGIELSPDEIEPQTFKNKVCPRCYHVNTPTASFCEVCGEVLDKETVLELEEAKKEIHEDERYIRMIQGLEEKVAALSTALTLAGVSVTEPPTPSQE